MREIYRKALAYMSMEAGKSHDRPSASGRLRKASCVVQRPESQTADDVTVVLKNMVLCFILY